MNNDRSKDSGKKSRKLCFGKVIAVFCFHVLKGIVVKW